MNDFESPEQKEDILRKAETFDAPGILKLLRENLAKNLSEEEKKDGFLHFEPSDDEIEKIIRDTGIYISLKGETVKGYFMTMSKELAATIPFEAEMIRHAEPMLFEDKPIKDYNYVVLAQICIAKEFKGGMTFHRLHAATHSMLKEEGFELGIGEIVDTNSLSLSVHRDLQDVGTYTASSGLKWHVKILDLRKD